MVYRRLSVKKESMLYSRVKVLRYTGGLFVYQYRIFFFDGKKFMENHYQELEERELKTACENKNAKL